MIYVIFLIMICLTSDAFLLMMEKGATLPNLKFKDMLVHGLIFGIVNMLILVLGFGIGKWVITSNLTMFHHFIAFIILDVLCYVILFKTFKRKPFIERVDQNYHYKDTFKSVFYCGIDTLLLGVSLSSYGISAPLLLLMSFISTFGVVVLAMFIGYHQGAAFQKQIGYICAFLYFIVAHIQLSKIFF